MGRPFLGTRPFVLRLLPVEIGVLQLAAARTGQRNAQAWAMRALWESACAVVGADRAAAIRTGAPLEPGEAEAIAGLVPAPPAPAPPPRPTKARPSAELVAAIDRQVGLGFAGEPAGPVRISPPGSDPTDGHKRQTARAEKLRSLSRKRDSRRQAAARKSRPTGKGKGRR